MDVAEQAVEAVGVVEARVGLEPDGRAAREQFSELRGGFRPVALVLPELGGVDLDEADALARFQLDRVAVADVRYFLGGGAVGGGFRARRASRESKDSGGDGE